MRKGGGKQKGSSFERKVCKALSLWVSKGELTDCFWRSAISGGRATVQHRKGVKVRQAGDICATSPEGQAFCERWFIECKHVRDLAIPSFLFKKTGPLHKYWKVACKQAKEHHKQPMLIAKENNGPILVIAPEGTTGRGMALLLESFLQHCEISLFEEMLRDDNPSYW